MTAASEESLPSNSQLRDDLDRSLQSLQSAAQTLLAKQEDIATHVASLADSPVQETARVAADLSKGAASILKSAEQLATAWTAALASIRASTGTAPAPPPLVGDFSLQKLARNDLSSEVRAIREALSACHVWDALKKEALAQGVTLHPMPSETPLDRIPELVAAKQIETRAMLERLAAPRILQTTLAEILAGESPPATPEGLLSSADWRTILEAAPKDANLHPLHGLALRCCAHSDPSKLLSDANDLLATFPQTGVAKTLSVLSFLTRDQFISLCSGMPGHSRELQATLVAALLCSQRSDYWFWEPLEEFTRQGRQIASKWRLLLHHLALATIAEGGFTALRQLVGEIHKTPAKPASDPRQLLQRLQDHLREPINCSDRTRFRLRQRAYQDLLAQLRTAVLTADTLKARQEQATVSQAQLARCYDRYASEIHLTSRSLRDHFIEDVEEVLQLTAHWLNATDPSRPDTSNPGLAESLRDCLHPTPATLASSDPEERAVVALGAYILAWSRGEPSATLSADFPLEVPSIFQQALPVTIALGPTEWRSFGGRVEHGNPSWSDWCLDQMDSWVGYSSPNIALHRFLRHDQLGAALRAHRTLAAQGIDTDQELAKQIDARMGSRRADLAARRAAVQARFASLNTEDREALEHDLQAVPEDLSAASVRAFEAALAAAQRRCDETTSRYEDQQRRAQVTAKLIALGQQPDPAASVQDLESAWRIAWESTSAQRAHIEPLRRFHSLLRDLPFSEATTAAEQVVLNLEAVQNWRGLQNAGDLELYLDTLFIEILGPLLSQAHNWLPDRRSDLLTLTLSWLESLQNPVWLKDTDSPCWRALKETAELEPKSLKVADALRILQNFGVPLSKASAPQPTPDPVQADASPKPPAARPAPQEQRAVGAPADMPTPQPKPPSTHGLQQRPSTSGTIVELRAALDTLLPPAGQISMAPSDLRKALEHQKWAQAAELAGADYRRLEQGGIANGQYAQELLIDFAAATILARPEETLLDLEVTARLLHIVNQFPDVIIRTNPQAGRTIEQLFLICLTQAWAVEFHLSGKSRDDILEDFRAYVRKPASDPMPGRLSQWFQKVFTPCSADAKQTCLMVDTAWSALYRGSHDTPVRGWLIWLCLYTANWPAVQRLLIKSNPEVITPDQAHYFQLLADERNANWQRFESFVTELRLRSRERPVFLNFAERLLHTRQVSKPSPVAVQLVGTLQQQRDGKTWVGQLRIEPPQIDPPATLELELPETADIRFAPTGDIKKRIDGGPFLGPTEVYCDFFLRNENLREQRPQVRCTGKTLSENAFDLIQEWEVRLRKEFFEPPTQEQISTIFRDFSPNPVQGKDYVQRPWDEREIKRILIADSKPGSLWLRAPRRSGKTSMLLRQMQAFGCRFDQPAENGIIHIEVSSWNHSEKSLSQHIWEQLWSGIRNRPFARVFAKEAEERSRPLTEESNIGVFLQEFAEFLITEFPQSLKRIYYFLDEADNLRGMHYSPDPKVTERCRSLLWQVRGLIQSTINVGVLFCTATAADRIFAERPEAPFYNSIPRYALQPFSTQTKEMEAAAREILQPPPLRKQFELLPSETVLHMLHITRGIPYYMKSVAGAAYATARSGYISRSDVNRATELLLGKKIGSVARELESPGMDELSVLDGGGSADRRVLAKAVMLAAANLLSGFDHPYLLREDLMRDDGPLKKEVRLTEKRIREGLDTLLELGFLATPQDKPLHLEFSIPILGESLRAEFRKLWNDILHHLEDIASRDARPPAEPAWQPAPLQPGDSTSLRAEVAMFLRERILDAEYHGREFFVSSAGALLQDRFPDKTPPGSGLPHDRPLYLRLGYPKLVDFLESIEGITVVGVAPRLTLKLESITDLRPRLIAAILELIDTWESSGRHLTAAVLGNQLLKRFPGDPPHQRLGFQSLAGFLYSVNEITVRGYGLHKVIHRAASTNPPTQATPHAT